MTAKEIEREIESVGDEARRLREELEKLDANLLELNNRLKAVRAIKEIPDAPRLACGETCWYSSSQFVPCSHETEYNIECVGFNYFHTERYAKEFTEKCAAIAMMLHCKWYLDRDYVPDWKDGNFKYLVFRDPATDRFEPVAQRRLGTGTIAFSTVDKAKKCAEWMNAHWKENSQ